MRKKPEPVVVLTRVVDVDGAIERTEMAIFASGVVREQSFVTTDAGGEIRRHVFAATYEYRSPSLRATTIEALRCANYQAVG